MSAKPYDAILKEARQLPLDEQQRLIRELSAPKNGDASKDDSPVDDGKVRTLYDALQARGLIGCLKDAPPDLSTNPKYMEGFGRDAG